MPNDNNNGEDEEKKKKKKEDNDDDEDEKKEDNDDKKNNERIEKAVKNLMSLISKQNEEKFIVAPIKKKETTPKTDIKENLAGNSKFNGLQVFHSQYGDVSTMRSYDKTCQILTMRIDPDPRMPEWQVS